MKAFTADKGEPLLDLALPVNSGVGPPMTFMLDGKQYIAVMGGTGAQGRGGPGGGRGGPAGGPPGGNGRGAPPAGEATAAAAQSGNNFPPAPAVTPANNNPKLMVYALPN